MNTFEQKRMEAIASKPKPKYKIGDRVSGKFLKKYCSDGIIVEIKEPEHLPFLTAHIIWTDIKYVVRWGKDPDDIGTWNEYDLEKIGV